MPENTNGSTTPHANGTSETGATPAESRMRRSWSSMIINHIYSRTRLARELMDEFRDIYKECHYPDTGDLTPQKYQELYDREAVAARVVEYFPHETWQVQPTVYESEDADEVTDFEAAWDSLGQDLTEEEESWYQDEAGSLVWEYMRRADEMSGIGSYGVMLLGFSDDGADLSVPVKPTTYKEGKRKLTYIRCFPEYLSQVVSHDTNPTSRRFGKPDMYSLTFHDPNRMSGVGPPITTRNVHWTRIVHLADTFHQASPSEVYAVPRLRPVLNNVLGIQKMHCAGPEGYWKTCFSQLFLGTDPQLGGDIDIDEESFKARMEEFYSGLDRVMAAPGFTPQLLSPSVIDPSPQVESQINVICIKLNVPVRIFKGSERGELASSQDAISWSGRVRGRQNIYATPRIVAPFVNRLIWLGVLPAPARAKDGKKVTSNTQSIYTKRHDLSTPVVLEDLSGGRRLITLNRRLLIVNAKGKVVGERKGGFSVEWPDLASVTDAEKADIATKRLGALSSYVQGGLEALMAPMDLFTRELGYDEEEARVILEAAAELAEEKAAEAEEAQVAQAAAGIPPGPPTGAPPSGPAPTGPPAQPKPQPPVAPQPAGKDSSQEGPTDEEDEDEEGTDEEPEEEEDDRPTSNTEPSQATVDLYWYDVEVANQWVDLENCGGPGSGIPGPCPGEGKGGGGSAKSLMERVDDLADATGKSQDAISQRLKEATGALERHPDLIGELADKTVGKVADIIPEVAKTAWQGAVLQQQVVSKSVQKNFGASKTVGNIVGTVTAALDSTILPGPASTVGVIAIGEVASGTAEMMGRGASFLRGGGGRKMLKFLLGNEATSNTDSIDPDEGELIEEGWIDIDEGHLRGLDLETLA